MSLAQNLVQSLAETQTDIDDDILRIDPYSRQIIIPKSITNLGVEHDDEVLTLTFMMPRKFSGVDFVDDVRTTYINYMNAQGETDVYHVAERTFSDTWVKFNWVVGPTATAYKGNTNFIVCIKKLSHDRPGEVEKEFNTTIATLPVLEGLEPDERIVTSYSDIIEQWRQQLFGVGDTEEANLHAVSSEEQAKITQKGEEVLASIPEDYTFTFNELERAARTKADAIVCSASGNAIVVTDSSDDGLRGLKLFGKTTQKTTTGANKLPYPFTQTTRTTNGITYTDNGDGSISVSGTATANAYLDLFNTPSPEIPGAYFLSGAPSNAGIKLYAYTGGAYKQESGNGVLLPNGVTSVHIVVSEGATVNTTVYPMLTEGTEALPWEPYSGGVPSPSPEWPQDMMDIECGDFAFYSGNIARANAIEKGANTSAISSENGYTIAVTGGADKPYTSSPIQLPIEYLRGKTIHLKADKIANSQNSSGKGGNVQLNIRSASTGMKYVAISPNNLHAVTTVPEDVTRIDLNIYSNNSNELFDVENTTTVEGLMLSLEDIPWEPYQDPQYFGWNEGSSTHWIYSGIPVTEGGNYTDASGQQWICDEAEFVDHSGNVESILHQHIYTLTLDGSENITMEERTGGTYRFIIRPSRPVRAIAAAGGFCSHFTYSLEPIGYNSEDWAGCVWNTGNVYCRYDNITSVDEMAAWLIAQKEAGTPVTFKYALEYEDIIETQPGLVEEYKKLHTNYPGTTLLTGTGADMELKYNADTKTWFENLPKANDDQVVAAVEAWLTAHFPNAEGVSF